MKKLIYALLLMVSVAASPAFAHSTTTSFWMKTEKDCGVHKVKFEKAHASKIRFFTETINARGETFEWKYIEFADGERPYIEQLSGHGHPMCIYFKSADPAIKRMIPKGYIIDTKTPWSE